MKIFLNASKQLQIWRHFGYLFRFQGRWVLLTYFPIINLGVFILYMLKSPKRKHKLFSFQLRLLISHSSKSTESGLENPPSMRSSYKRHHHARMGQGTHGQSMETYIRNFKYEPSIKWLQNKMIQHGIIRPEGQPQSRCNDSSSLSFAF